MTYLSALLKPDNGEAPTVGVTVTPTPVEAGWWDRASGWANQIPDGAWIALGALVLAGVAYRLIRNRRNPTAAKSDKLMTFIGAAVATGVVGTGMWAFFGDTLGIANPWLRAALFAFFEIAMLASALRSRRFRLDRAAAQATEDTDDDSHEVDVDGIAVWVLALLSGTLAATHEHQAGAIGLRLVAPLIAAWLWERGLAGELRQFRRTARRRAVNWKLTPERVAVWLRLAEPTGREVGQVDRARRIAQFARTAYRLHTLESDGASRARIAVARWRLRRQVEQINEHLSLATDRSVMAEVRAHLATLYQAREGTKEAAVKSLTPWTDPGLPGHAAHLDAHPMPGHAPAITSGTTPAITSGNGSGMPVDIVTGQAPDISPDAHPAPSSDTRTGIDTGARSASNRTETRTPGRASGRARKPSPAQVKAYKLRAKNPDITWAELAAKCGVNERTARRWFEAGKGPDDDGKELALRPDIVTVLPAPRLPVTSGVNGHRVVGSDVRRDG